MNIFKIKGMAYLAILLLSSCTGEFDFDKYVPNNGEAVGSDSIDTSFAFSTRTSTNLLLYAIDEQGEYAETAKFSVYTEYPYAQANDSSDVSRRSDIAPLYQGFTDADGKISITLDVPINVDSLYILPELSGFGAMQTVALSDASAGLVFMGRQMSDTKAIQGFRKGLSTRALSETSPFYRDPVSVGNNYKFYHYFNADEIDLSNGELISVEGGVVSTEILSTKFKNMVNCLFPESQRYTGDMGDTDLLVNEDGLEVFATYIGDGGYSTINKNIYNGFYYYTYTKDNKPSSKYENTKSTYHLTAVFPNVHDDNIQPGRRVQLMYFDENLNKYTNIFPKGTYIGFALNYDGYTKIINGKKNRAFSLNTAYFSTTVFNIDLFTHGLIFWNDEYRCYVVGMERDGKDCDFNDILAKVTFSGSAQQAQVGYIGYENVGITAPTAVSRLYGTYAFEDLWPSKGDYDFNDYVVSYEYKLTKNTSNKVTDVTLKYIPRAVGATSKNGFGIQLAIAKSNIESIEGASIEENADHKATIIVYEDVRSAFGGASGFINTQQGSEEVLADTTTIKIKLITPMSESDLTATSFNPFLFASSRSHEIHLVNFAPTSFADELLFGTLYDKSDKTISSYYRMDNNYPWALDIAWDAWRWPCEIASGVTLAYPKFESWYDSWSAGKVLDWTENVDETYLWK